jgi:hypothetical protein
MRTIKFNPDDPDWKFPYASRRYIDRLRVLFEQTIPDHLRYGWTWKNQPRSYTHALPDKVAAELRKTTRWPSVPPEHRAICERYFQEKMAALTKRYGATENIPPGKVRAYRMVIAKFGRYNMTGKRMYALYRRRIDRSMWHRYLDWERQQNMAALPKTASKVLDVG